MDGGSAVSRVALTKRVGTLMVARMRLDLVSFGVGGLKRNGKEDGREFFVVVDLASSVPVYCGWSVWGWEINGEGRQTGRVDAVDGVLSGVVL